MKYIVKMWLFRLGGLKMVRQIFAEEGWEIVDSAGGLDGQ